MIDYSLSKKLSCVYQNAHPFPYTVIDNFLPDYLLKRVLSELKQHDYWYHNNQRETKQPVKLSGLKDIPI